MHRILCFGDSNTWGYISESGERYPENIRWTGRLSILLGEDYRILEEGLNGRTTGFDEGACLWRNAERYLVPCLISQSPLDLIILMLGTNDTKRMFHASVWEIADSMKHLLRETRDCLYGNGSKATILLVAPPPMTEAALQDPEMDLESVEKSRQLGGAYRALAQKLSLPFLDAGAYELALQPDGCHLNEDGHALLAEIMAQKVREILP